eukprot:374709_1
MVVIEGGEQYKKKQWLLLFPLFFYIALLKYNKEGFFTPINNYNNRRAVKYIKKNLYNDTIYDRMKYINTNHSLCDTLHYSQILISAHHKTGSQLIGWQFSTKTLGRYLHSKCPMKPSFNIKPRGPYYDYVGHLHETDIDLFIAKILNRTHKIPSNYILPHIVFIHVIRNPIDTILSAYNYHKQGKELWTHHTPLWYYSETCEAMNISTNISLFTLYNEILTTELGIYVEYYAYIEFLWNEIYPSYRRLNYLQKYYDFNYDYNLFHVKQFRLEDFKINFNKTCNEYMDVMGVLQNEDRQYLMKGFQAFSMNNPKRRAKKHLTIGTYNKTKQLQILLELNVSNVMSYHFQTSQQRCLILKEKTEILGYKWNFKHVC